MEKQRYIKNIILRKIERGDELITMINDITIESQTLFETFAQQMEYVIKLHALEVILMETTADGIMRTARLATYLAFLRHIVYSVQQRDTMTQTSLEMVIDNITQIIHDQYHTIIHPSRVPNDNKNEYIIYAMSALLCVIITYTIYNRIT